jgi:hypothetical protein
VLLFKYFLIISEMAEEDKETITLRVKDQGGDEMFFKVKKNTVMKVMNFCTA